MLAFESDIGIVIILNDNRRVSVEKRLDFRYSAFGENTALWASADGVEPRWTRLRTT